MSKVPSLILALLFCLMPLFKVSAEPDIPGDDLIETSFSGTIINSVTQKPISQLDVYGHDDDFKMMRSTKTDENGKYYLEFKDGGHYTLYAEHEDYEPATQEATVNINSNTIINFSLIPKVYEIKVYGIITDANTGKPLSDAFVQLLEKVTYEDGEYYSTVVFTKTGDDGKYSFEAYEGTYQIEVGKEGYNRYISSNFSLESGEELEYNVELSPWATGVSGTVYDENGDPFPGVTVSLESDNRNSWEYTTTTDENGEYEIRVPRGGDFTLKAFMDGYRPYNQEIIIPEDSMVEQDIEITKALLPDPLLRILYLILSLLGLM